MYDLRIVVDEIRGFCDLPMALGDYCEVKGGRLIIPEGKHMCIWALASILPMLPAKQRNIVEENDWLPSTSRMCCPDPNGLVIYRIERINETKGINNTNATNEPFPRILVDEKVCSGCRTCEMTCSFQHTEAFSINDSRIRIDKDEANGLDMPRVCRQCGTARCVEACKFGALSRDPQTKAIVLDKEQCTGCLACKKACSFQAVQVQPSSKQPMLCDLCGGNPQCVERCATGALTFGRAGEAPLKGGAKAAIK
ncbi:MAG: TIGR04076 family protein [Bacillota bacterium]|nr:TIGR04076 family protein [Bacillota bacterium]